MKAAKTTALLVACIAMQARGNNVSWTLTGPAQVGVGEPVAWEASLEVTGENQGLAGYAFNIIVGPGAGPTPGADGQWGTADDQNLANVEIPPATFNSIFQVTGSSPPPGSVDKTGGAGGPGMNVLPYPGKGTLIRGELLQVGASYLDWAAYPGQNGQTAGVGMASRKGSLLANPGGTYALNAGIIPTTTLAPGTYTVLLIPVATRTLRPDLNLTQNQQGFIMQPATATGSSFTFSLAVPDVPADFNNDGDVDGDDFMLFVACVTGPAIPYGVAVPPGCGLTFGANNVLEADLDADGDVDHDDFGVFQRCFSGAGVLGNPGCAQ